MVTAIQQRTMPMNKIDLDGRSAVVTDGGWAIVSGRRGVS
jgi:hypothetical protein